MKQKFRALKTGLICCALALLSCQDDLPDQIGEDPHGHTKHTYLDFETFSQQFPETASKVRGQNDKAKDHLQRGVYDPENDFTIETDKIFMGENEGGSYITFKVSKEGDSDGLDNLVLKINSENEVTPMLLHYDLTEQEKAGLSNNEPIENIGSKMSFEILDGTVLNTSNTTNKMECSTFVVAECLYGNHPNGLQHDGTRCPGYTETTVTTCSGSGSGGGPPNIPIPPVSPPNTGSNPGQSGGGGGVPGTGTYNPNGPSVPVITTPVTGEAYRTPCEKLQNISNVDTINKSLKSLRGKTNLTKENAFSFETVLSATAPAVIPAISSNVNSARIRIRNNTFGTAHTHQDGIYPMFTPADLRSICKFANNYVSPPQGSEVNYDDLFFNMMVVESNTQVDEADSPHGFAYAMYPNNPDTFKQICEILDNPNKAKSLNDDLIELYTKAGEWNDVNQLRLATIYLKYINDATKSEGCGINFNISLYRKQFDANKNLTGQWEKLELSPVSPNGIKKTPCN